MANLCNLVCVTVCDHAKQSAAGELMKKELVDSQRALKATRTDLRTTQARCQTLEGVQRDLERAREECDGLKSLLDANAAMEKEQREDLARLQVLTMTARLERGSVSLWSRTGRPRSAPQRTR